MKHLIKQLNCKKVFIKVLLIEMTDELILIRLQM